MPDFALVTEGITDHAIIKNILLGYFQFQREPDIHRELPDPYAEKHHGGWTLVLKYLRDKKFRGAFQHNDYLIIQVDTDVAEDSGFDVAKQDSNGPIPLESFLRLVTERLCREIGEEDLEYYGDKFIFAIAVEQLECWVLPIWMANARGRQTANCTNRLGNCQAVREALNRRNQPHISRGRKDYGSYDIVSRDYTKRSILIEKGPSSPSLKIFLQELDRRNIQLSDLD